jgi:ABC-type transport system substrate-binding protein
MSHDTSIRVSYGGAPLKASSGAPPQNQHNGENVMNKSVRAVLLVFVLLMVLLSACASASTPVSTAVPSTFTPSPMPPTVTPEPTLTATTIPSPTSLPGSVVLPVDTLGTRNPWLPLDKTARPGVNFVGFNTLKPPFNNVLVRQAFAYAIDRDTLVEMATRYKAKNAVHATTLVPSETLGRNLYGEVGAVFDPQIAKDLLTQAGYSDPSSFPNVVFMVNVSGDTAPGARFNMATAMVGMWKTHLGITVEVQVVQSFSEYNDRLKTNATELYWLGWAADFNDPDNFLRELFASNSEYNYGGFSDSEFDLLVSRAKNNNDPAERQQLYIQAERLLCETEAGLIPLFHSTSNLP